MKLVKQIKTKFKNFRCGIAQRKFFLPAAFLSILLTLFLGWFSQFLFISEFLKRANAELATPIVGYEYNKERDKRVADAKIPEITILKVTDADLNAAEEIYPPSHRYHARRLKELLDYGAPKALFIDILFLNERSEAQQLLSALCELRKAGSKIYIASILPESELSADFKGLTQPANEALVWPEGDNTCELLAAEVSVRKQTDDFTNQAWSYCLNDSLAVDADQSNRNSKCQNIRNNSYGIKTLNSAAYQIYLDMGHPGINLGNTSEMALTWGTERNENENDQKACRLSNSVFDWLGLPNVIKGIFSAKSIKPFCPYFNEFTINELQNEELDTRESLIKNNVVFYGYQLDGINDFSYVPAHGIQQSINVHAMALDNMLVYEEKAKSGMELFDSFRLVAFNVMLLLLIFLITEIWTNCSLTRRFKSYVVRCRCLPHMQHTMSFLSMLALIIVSPVVIKPIMCVGSGLLNLGVMGWIEYTSIGFLSEVLGIRHKIEDDLCALQRFIKQRRYS